MSNRPSIDEKILIIAAKEHNVDIDILRSLITSINPKYTELKDAGKVDKNMFHDLWITAIQEEERIDLLTFQSYKEALSKYYHLRKTSTFVVEYATSAEARILVSEGMSMVFGAIKSEGKLSINDVTHRYNALHPRKDVKDSLVMREAKQLACKAMNAKRKPTRRRKAA